MAIEQSSDSSLESLKYAQPAQYTILDTGYIHCIGRLGLLSSVAW